MLKAIHTDQRRRRRQVGTERQCAIGRVIAVNTPTRQPVHPSGSGGTWGCTRATYGTNVVPLCGPGSLGHRVDGEWGGFNYFRSVSPSCRPVLDGFAAAVAAGTRACTTTISELSVGAGGSGVDAKAARPIDHVPPPVSRDSPLPSAPPAETPSPVSSVFRSTGSYDLHADYCPPIIANVQRKSSSYRITARWEAMEMTDKDTVQSLLFRVHKLYTQFYFS